MDRFMDMWQSLEDEEYRHEYSADVSTGLAFQIRMLREKNGWTQEQLADRTSKKQETISQWENPDYGSYTLTTLQSLAAAFDVALMVKFAPFSELVDWNVNLTPEVLAPRSYIEEALEKTIAAQSFTLPSEVFVSSSELATSASVFWTGLEGFVEQAHGTTAATPETDVVLGAGERRGRIAEAA